MERSKSNRSITSDRANKAEDQNDDSTVTELNSEPDNKMECSEVIDKASSSKKKSVL
jgi:hypothetical protein